MNIVDYPFIKAAGAEARPALFIRLISPETGLFQDTKGYIDTGASDCCFPIDYAKIIGLNPQKGKKSIVRTAKNISEAYVHKCTIKVWNTNEFFNDKKVIAYEVPNVNILFMPELMDVLLGVSFWDNKVLTIDYSHKIFSLLDPV
jgi:hypothetical protein